MPVIGLPQSIKNGNGTDIPRSALAGTLAKPRLHRLKTLLTLYCSDPTALASADQDIAVRVQGLKVASTAAIQNTDGSDGINGLIPIVSVMPGSAAAGATQFRLAGSSIFIPDTDIVEVTILLGSPPAAPSVFNLLIDFSH